MDNTINKKSLFDRVKRELFTALALSFHIGAMVIVIIVDAIKLIKNGITDTDGIGLILAIAIIIIFSYALKSMYQDIKDTLED